MHVKNNQLSNLAHKATSPLTSIMGYIALCSKEIDTTKDLSKIKEWLDDCSNSVESLKDIIRQIGVESNS